MKSPLDSLLARYSLQSVDDSWQALREITQEIVLLGLWRSKFFEPAAFYGGTALRIFYGLNRFSEDLDFSLRTPEPGFSLEPYFVAVKQELQAYGFEGVITQSQKSSASAIKSAFVKMNTRQGLLSLGVPQKLIQSVSREQVLKIKFEVDVDPPPGFETEALFHFLPQSFSVRLFDLQSMFAGKLHAVLARAWKSRVKGRDWFDFVWFVANNHPASLQHLKARLVQTGHLQPQDIFTAEKARNLLHERVKNLDVEAAKKDIQPFIKDSAMLQIWSTEFFVDVVNRTIFK